MKFTNLYIKGASNGFYVDATYALPEDESGYTKYKQKTTVFNTWDEVVDWVKNNKVIERDN